MVNNGATSSGTTSAPNNNISSRTPALEGTSDATSSTQHIVEGQSIEGTFAREAVRQIKPIIELFRTDKIKKSQAIYRIGQVLAAEPTGNERLKSDALEQYAGTLDRIESLAASADKHGARVTITGPMHERRVGGPGKRSREHAEFDRHIADEPEENDVNGFLAKLSKGLEPGVEQDEREERSGEDSDQELEANDGIEERGWSNKKQKVYESQMPWFSTEQ